MVEPDFESRLISEVRRRKELYDSNILRSREQLNQIWSDIAIALNADECYCRVRWKSLRNQYRKVKVKIHARGGMENYMKKWKYFDEMSFIDPFLISTDKLGLSDDQSQRLDDANSSTKFAEKLIYLVRQNELIYNKDHRFYHQKVETKAAWAGISETLNVDSKICREQWLVIRSCYQRLKRKVNRKGGLSIYTPRWRLFKKMSFVDKWDSTNLLPENELAPLKEDDLIINYLSENETCEEENFCTELSTQNDELLSDDLVPEEKYRSKTTLRRRKKNIVHRNTTSESEMEMELNDNESNEIQNANHCEINRDKSQNVNSSIVTSTSIVVDSSCATYFSMLGMKIDEISVPSRVRYDLERRITHLVYDVISTHGTEADN